MSENPDSADRDGQEHSFTRTIDEEAEMEEQAERERGEGHLEQEDEEEEREHEVMTAGSKWAQGQGAAQTVQRGAPTEKISGTSNLDSVCTADKFA